MQDRCSSFNVLTQPPGPFLQASVQPEARAMQGHYVIFSQACTPGPFLQYWKS